MLCRERRKRERDMDRGAQRKTERGGRLRASERGKRY